MPEVAHNLGYRNSPSGATPAGSSSFFKSPQIADVDDSGGGITILVVEFLELESLIQFDRSMIVGMNVEAKNFRLAGPGFCFENEMTQDLARET